MKRTRLLILTALVLATLLVAVIPALAVSEEVYYNYSFERDADNNGRPDRWRMPRAEDDLLYVCGHPYEAFTDGRCLMLFLPDHETKMFFQLVNVPTDLESEELALPIGVLHAAADGLEANRAFLGFILHFDGAPDMTIYSPIKGGTYNFHTFDVWYTWTTSPPQVQSFHWGVVMSPGSGRLAVDRVFPFP